MISQNQIKHITALQQKKFRAQYQQFIVEGEKMVNELLCSDFEIYKLFATKDYLPKNNHLDIVEISAQDLKRISTLKTPNKVVAVAKLPLEKDLHHIPDDFSLVLDQIQDPGNLGTIIRTADWFGIKNIFCSKNSVDCYNAKVVQSTMGSIFRVNVQYIDLNNLFALAKNNNIDIIGTSLQGDNLYQYKFPQKALIVMGNESKGISLETQQNITHAVRIPSFPENANVESLNVSVATALICAELRHP